MEKLPVDNVLDITSDKDYLFDEWKEYADGEGIERPTKHIVMFSQLKTLMCTWFGLDVIVRANNILEDIANTGEVVRGQVNPLDIYIDDRPHYLANRLDQFRKEGRIEGYVTIPRWLSLEEKNKQLQEALTRGFIYTGTNYVGWTIPQKPLLSFRKTKQAGHAFAIVDYKDGLYKIANSFGTERGDGGYGYIKDTDVDKLFTCYQIIDKKDTEYFQKFRLIQKAKEAIKNLKSLYSMGDRKVNKMLEEVQITNKLKYILGFKY